MQDLELLSTLVPSLRSRVLEAAQAIVPPWVQVSLEGPAEAADFWCAVSAGCPEGCKGTLSKISTARVEFDYYEACPIDRIFPRYMSLWDEFSRILPERMAALKAVHIGCYARRESGVLSFYFWLNLGYCS